MKDKNIKITVSLVWKYLEIIFRKLQTHDDRQNERYKSIIGIKISIV